VYCLPAGWIWGDHGFLNRMGVVDIAGSGPVHLVGGVSGNRKYIKEEMDILYLIIHVVCYIANRHIK